MDIQIVEVGANSKPVTDYNKAIKYGIPQSTNNRPIAPVTVEKTYKGKNGRTYTKKERIYGGLGNANILAIMEAGSPVNNIPARPLLEPVRKKYEKQIDEYLENVVISLLMGDRDGADRLMEELALRVETWTKKFFTDPDNGWAENAPSTIRAKGSDKPLIDTGELRKSVRAVVVEDK